jgi:hypothetical protein
MLASGDADFTACPSNALPFRCEGRYEMADSTTAGAEPPAFGHLVGRAAPAQ